MRPLRLLLAVVIVVAVILPLALAPPAPRSLSVPQPGRAPVRGALHIHTRRSDGTGTAEQIATAAANAGLSFVVLTDHGDAVREPERPSYQHGVLCIDAVEISTTGGHVVAIGLPRSPYPLGGEPRDVVEDIARLGGMSIAAHPTSSKAALRWRDWAVPVDGMEWLNGDSEWRDEPVTSLGRALLTYPVRRAATLAALLDRPEESLRRWDDLTKTRDVVALAASDAHARLGFRPEGDPFEPRVALHVPSYEQVFRAFSVAIPELTLTRDAAADAMAVLDAIRKGHIYSSIDGLAGPAYVLFGAERGGAHAQAGDTIAAGAPARFLVRSNAPDDAQITLLQDGRPVARAMGGMLQHTSGEPGVYRVEIQLTDAPGHPPIPWIVTNPIYVRAKQAATISSNAAAVTFSPRYDDGEADGWSVEKSANSQGALNVVRALDGKQLAFRFALGGSEGESPFVGLVMPAGSIAGADRIAFRATASRPMRLSVQLRTADGAAGERWKRSVYLDETARMVTVKFDEMNPIGGAATYPVIERVRDVLFVIDTTNARPGSNGQIWLDDIKYGR